MPRMTTVLVAISFIVFDGKASACQVTQGLVFVNANVVTMEDNTIRGPYTVVVLGDSIATVGPSTDVVIPAGATVFDARGRYLLPGLADMHVHIHDASELLSFVGHGVTTVLQMNLDSRAPSNLPLLRRQLMNGEILGPTMYSAGPLFDQYRFTPSGRQQVTVENLDQVLAGHVADGYDFIKVHNMIPPDIYRALIRADILPVIGHLPVLLAPEDGLRSGQRMLAHAELLYYKYFFDSSCLETASFWECTASISPDYGRIPEIARLVDSVGITVTANLSYVAADLRLTQNPDSVLADPNKANLAPHVLERWLGDLPADRSFPELRRRDVETRYPWVTQMVKALADAGVPLLAGTDTPLPGLYPGSSLHLELAELVRAGLSPFDALAASTVAAGEFIRDHVPGSEPFGMIRPGYRADLVLVEGNPFEDIANVAAILGVVVRGTFVTPEEIGAMR